MSEITRGIIGMPFELAMSSELSRRQFYACAQGLIADFERVDAELSACKEGPGTCGYWRDTARAHLAEIEELRKDAERYRWILQNASLILDQKTAYPAETGFIKFDTMPARTETQSAIDWAMSKEASHG